MANQHREPLTENNLTFNRHFKTKYRIVSNQIWPKKKHIERKVLLERRRRKHKRRIRLPSELQKTQQTRLK